MMEDMEGKLFNGDEFKIFIYWKKVYSFYSKFLVVMIKKMEVV